MEEDNIRGAVYSDGWPSLAFTPHVVLGVLSTLCSPQASHWIPSSQVENCTETLKDMPSIVVLNHTTGF